MRILTWNCHGAFRRKFHLLDHFEADVLVIQECEEPSALYRDYNTWATQYVWTGDNKSKGLGIFVKDGHAIEALNWSTAGASYFLPARVNNDLEIIGVWTQTAQATRDKYVGQLWTYLEANADKLHENTIVCGDFNSNTICDKPKQYWNHGQCVERLAKSGLVSLYHTAHAEPQGQERCPTFYLQRNLAKPYHIDYAFAHPSRFMTANPSFQIGAPEHWLQHSDHMPLVCDLVAN